MKTEEQIKAIESKIESMPNLKLYYINHNQCGIICTYALLRIDTMIKLKEELELRDIYVTWMPCKNPEGIVIECIF